MVMIKKITKKNRKNNNNNNNRQYKYSIEIVAARDIKWVDLGGFGVGIIGLGI